MVSNSEGKIVLILEITARGGRGIAVYVDHSNMDDVKAFFDRIENENQGQLDILVNNAYSAVHVSIYFSDIDSAFRL